VLSDLSANISATFSKVATLNKKTEKVHEKQIRELKSNIEHSRAELASAIENFNNVTEPKLIDFYIYRIQSEQTRFEQLLCEYKAIERLDCD